MPNVTPTCLIRALLLLDDVFPPAMQRRSCSCQAECIRIGFSGSVYIHLYSLEFLLLVVCAG